MSTNTANVTVNFSTNANSVSSEIAKLRSETTDLAETLGDVRQQADRADDSLERLGSTNGRASTATGGMASSLRGLAGPLLTAGVAIKGLELGGRALTAVFNAYVESNDHAASKVSQLTEQFNDLKVQFGEVIFGGGRFDEIVNILSENLQNLARYVSDNQDKIQKVVDTFIEMTDIGTGVVSFLLDVSTEFLKYSDYALWVVNLLTPFDELWTLVKNIASSLESMGDRLAGLGSYLGLVSSATEEVQIAAPAIQQVDTSVQTLTSSYGQFMGLFSDVSAWQTATVEADANASANTRVAESIDKITEASLKLLSLGEIKSDKSNPMNPFGLSEGAKAAAALQEQKGQEATAQEAILAQQEAFLLKRKEQTELFYQQQEENEANRVARLQEILGEGGTVIGGALSEGIGAAIEGKDFGKSVLKSFGDYLAKKGSAMITEGSVDLLVGGVSGNPQQVAAGAAKLGGGAALIAAGKGLGSAGKDGKKATSSGASATPTPQSSQPVQNVYNVSTNVGMVGDQRSFGREMKEQLDRFKRLGG